MNSNFCIVTTYFSSNTEIATITISTITCAFRRRLVSMNWRDIPSRNCWYSSGSGLIFVPMNSNICTVSICIRLEKCFHLRSNAIMLMETCFTNKAEFATITISAITCSFCRRRVSMNWKDILPGIGHLSCWCLIYVQINLNCHIISICPQLKKRPIITFSSSLLRHCIDRKNIFPRTWNLQQFPYRRSFSPFRQRQVSMNWRDIRSRNCCHSNGWCLIPVNEMWLSCRV